MLELAYLPTTTVDLAMVVVVVKAVMVKEVMVGGPVA